MTRLASTGSFTHRRRLTGLAVAAPVAALLLVEVSSARAQPSPTAGVTIGVAGEGYRHQFWKRRTAMHLGLRGDVMFLRKSNFDIGLGPYAEVMTHGFDTLEFGGGISALFPVIDTFPMIFGFGGYGRFEGRPFGLEPGIVGTFLWGPRSYNFHFPYVMSGGVLVQVRYGLGHSGETSIVIGAQLDLGIMAVPAIFLINAIRGTSNEAKPIK